MTIPRARYKEPLAGGILEGVPPSAAAITDALEDALLTGLAAAFRSRAAFGLSLSLSLAGCLCLQAFASLRPGLKQGYTPP